MNQKVIIILALLVFHCSGAHGADSIGEAYAQEFTFLKAQKSELEKRLASEASTRRRAERRAEAEIISLQARFLDLSAEVNAGQLELADLRLNLEDASNNTEVVEGVLSQMESTLSPYGLATTFGGSDSTREKLKQGFLSASALINRFSTLQLRDDVFFLADGTQVSGQIANIGNIAAYGFSDSGAGVLVPAGGGKLRLWEQGVAEVNARNILDQSFPASMPLFIFENRDAEVTPPEVKTLESVIESGGIIGYVILGLGALGLLCVVYRFLYLLTAGSRRSRLVRRIVRYLNKLEIENARKVLHSRHGAVPTVLRDLVNNIGSDRERLDDVISESIIRESGKLDRLGSLILVIAGVAPLLGLLGTVSGMISTFDAITQFGTGDPKLLAGGISVALVTTMLGLIVAIPLLLLGNLLTGWAQKTKDAMERSALHLINQFEKARAPK